MKKINPVSSDERSGGIQVIARASAILNALGNVKNAGMSLAEIAKEVQLPRSTVQRIVQALAQEGIVQSDRSDGVRLGSTLLKLVARVHTNVVAIMTPHLDQLCRELDETVALGRVSGTELAFVHVAVAERELRVVPQVGANLPLHSTSAGRALLALDNDENVLALLGNVYAGVTQKTLRSADDLLRELAVIRVHGYAQEFEETEVGVSSVAIAVDSVLGRYAVAVVVPSGRLSGRQDLIFERILSLKTALQAEIGK